MPGGLEPDPDEAQIVEAGKGSRRAGIAAFFAGMKRPGAGGGFDPFPGEDRPAAQGIAEAEFQVRARALEAELPDDQAEHGEGKPARGDPKAMARHARIPWESRPGSDAKRHSHGRGAKPGTCPCPRRAERLDSPMSRVFHVRVGPLPPWLDWQRLLGAGPWSAIEQTDGRLEARAELERDAAADLTARLRGVGIGGALLNIEVLPPLQRKDLRKAHTAEARRYREGSTGFGKRAARLDDEGRVSLTPEALALALGERARGLRVIDACAGAGGNAIGFARAGCAVVAIELDPGRLAMARHNAKLYGVADRIEFIAGDARLIVPAREGDLLFIDPPWGPRYDKERVTLDELPPCRDLLESAAHLPRRWIKVPPSFDPATLPGWRAEAVFGVARGDERRVKFLLMEDRAEPAG